MSVKTLNCFQELGQLGCLYKQEINFRSNNLPEVSNMIQDLLKLQEPLLNQEIFRGFCNNDKSPCNVKGLV